MKKYLVIFMMILMLTLTGCEEAPISELPSMSIETVVDDDGNVVSQITSLTQDVELEKGMVLSTTYDTCGYNIGQWRITDSKTIRMETTVKNLVQGAEVLIEHVHIDMSIKSTLASTDGWLQDTMDDSYHGTSQDGFDITIYPYSNIFAIQGLSEKLLWFWDGTGSESRLTEQSLLARNVYANKMMVVFDVLIKYEGDTHYHVVSVSNEFLIPVRKYSTTTETQKDH